jgi:hypothetical protein
MDTMRLAIILLIMSLGGCKTAEFAFIYPTTGVHMVAKFEAKEDETQQGPSLQR